MLNNNLILLIDGSDYPIYSIFAVTPENNSIIEYAVNAAVVGFHYNTTYHSLYKRFKVHLSGQQYTTVSLFAMLYQYVDNIFQFN